VEHGERRQLHPRVLEHQLATVVVEEHEPERWQIVRDTPDVDREVTTVLAARREPTEDHAAAHELEIGRSHADLRVERALEPARDALSRAIAEHGRRDREPCDPQNERAEPAGDQLPTHRHRP
jgi:hypothetical protein